MDDITSLILVIAKATPLEFLMDKLSEDYRNLKAL